MTDTAIGTGIRVTATHKIFFIIAAILYKPIVKVDGTAHKIGWGSAEFIPTSAGSHEIEVFYKLYWVIPVAKRKTTVNVAEGSVAAIQYDLSLFSYSAKLAAA
jgi:hypothetical protein